MHSFRPGRIERVATPGLRRAALAALLAVSLTLVPASPAAAVDYEEFGQKAFDLVVLRPLNAAAVLVGLGFFAITAPMVLPTGDLSTPFDVFVYSPYEYAFERPLGDI